MFEYDVRDSGPILSLLPSFLSSSVVDYLFKSVT